MSDESECKVETLTVGIINETVGRGEKCQQLYSFLKEKDVIYSTSFYNLNYFLSEPSIYIHIATTITWLKYFEEPVSHDMLVIETH